MTEPTQVPVEAVRYKLVLGKFRVDKVNEMGGALEFSIHLPGLGHLICTGPKADVREGDLLTLYTEILSDAQPSRSPIQ